jgi:hypothetical protein
MNSFRLTAVGQLARNPELSIKSEITFARFCLIGDDEVSDGEEDGPREVVTSLWFFAFGDIASTFAHNAGKGDQTQRRDPSAARTKAKQRTRSTARNGVVHPTRFATG